MTNSGATAWLSGVALTTFIELYMLEGLGQGFARIFIIPKLSKP